MRSPLQSVSLPQCKAVVGKASKASAVLEQALITHFGTLGRIRESFLLRSDNGLVFTGRDTHGWCAAMA